MLQAKSWNVDTGAHSPLAGRQFMAQLLPQSSGGRTLVMWSAPPSRPGPSPAVAPTACLARRSWCSTRSWSLKNELISRLVAVAATATAVAVMPERRAAMLAAMDGEQRRFTRLFHNNCSTIPLLS